MDKHSDTHKYTFALKLFQSTKEDLAEGEKRTRSRVGPATEGIAAINKKSRARREALSRLNRVKNRRENHPGGWGVSQTLKCQLRASRS